MVEPDISELTGISNIFDDDWTRTIYSVDASHCCVKPMAVNFPSDKYRNTGNMQLRLFPGHTNNLQGGWHRAIGSIIIQWYYNGFY